MLKPTKGASIDEILEVFDWRPHTVRGAIAGQCIVRFWPIFEKFAVAMR